MTFPDLSFVVRRKAIKKIYAVWYDTVGSDYISSDDALAFALSSDKTRAALRLLVGDDAPETPEIMNTILATFEGQSFGGYYLRRKKRQRTSIWSIEP